MITSNDITGRTTICGLIGDPVGHSLSPHLHNAAFRSLSMDYVYVPFEVKKKDLKKAVDGIRSLNIRGVNVTMPHKEEVMRFIDELDPDAEKIGAVNTLVNNGGIVRGYNTDAEGYLNSLLERNIDPQGKNVIMFGSGGAAKAIAFILMRRGALLTIVNRTKSRAQCISNDLLKAIGRKPEILDLMDIALARRIRFADIVINATNVGMNPNLHNSLIDISLLRKNMVVSDIVYVPAETRLLRDAQKAGAVTVSGIDMLVWQAALAFEKWTGLKAPVDIMRKSMLPI
jgi:shikimate dehydrogenase